MSETRTCHFCGTVTDTACPVCTATWHLRRDPAEMTPDEREAEMRALYGPLEVSFSLVHERLTALVGRNVWAHEIGLNPEGLIAEARARTGKLDMNAALDPLLETGKPIVVIKGDGQEAE